MRLPLLQRAEDVIRWASELVRSVEIAVSNLIDSKQTKGEVVRLPSFTVSTVPSAATESQLIYVSNESGGAVVAFSDGTNWRRVTDRAIIS